MTKRDTHHLIHKNGSDEPTSRRADEPTWRKAAASDSGGNCVQVAALADGGIAVRDSKDPDGPRLIFTIPEWAAFAHAMANGEFDDLLLKNTTR